MSSFVALIFEFHTSYPTASATVWIKWIKRLCGNVDDLDITETASATVWIKVTTDEWLKTYIPLDYQSSFQAIGPLHLDAAEQVVRALKNTLAELAIECFEHTDSDD